MRTTWWARRTEATGGTTSPHPVIMGNGRLESRASPPFIYRAAPPHLPPLKEGTGVSPPRRRDKRAPPGEGATDAELRSSATKATRARALLGPGPTTLGTVCGPGPGAPVGVLK